MNKRLAKIKKYYIEKGRKQGHHEVLEALVDHGTSRDMSYRYFIYDKLGYPTGKAYSDFFYCFGLFQYIGEYKDWGKQNGLSS